jgi:hypothetical protein
VRGARGFDCGTSLLPFQRYSSASSVKAPRPRQVCDNRQFSHKLVPQASVSSQNAGCARPENENTSADAHSDDRGDNPSAQLVLNNPKSDTSLPTESIIDSDRPTLTIEDCRSVVAIIRWVRKRDQSASGLLVLTPLPHLRPAPIRCPPYSVWASAGTWAQGQ